MKFANEQERAANLNLAPAKQHYLANCTRFAHQYFASKLTLAQHNRTSFEWIQLEKQTKLVNTCLYLQQGLDLAPFCLLFALCACMYVNTQLKPETSARLYAKEGAKKARVSKRLVNRFSSKLASCCSIMSSLIAVMAHWKTHWSGRNKRRQTNSHKQQAIRIQADIWLICVSSLCNFLAFCFLVDSFVLKIVSWFSLAS